MRRYTHKVFKGYLKSSAGVWQFAGAATIRWLVPSDVQDVMDLSDQCEEFSITQDELGYALMDPAYSCIVATINDHVVAYITYELGEDALHIIRLAVHPIIRREGLGTELLEAIKAKQRLQNIKKLQAVVCETNLGGQLFLKAGGLKATGEVLRDRTDTTYGYLMQIVR